MEEYFPADRLLELNIGAVVQVLVEHSDLHFSVRLVGVDSGNYVITSMPAEHSLPDAAKNKKLFDEHTVFEMKTIHDGYVVAFEVSPIVVYSKRLMICSFPEMVETRRLRRDTRFPCAMSCDIRYREKATFGVISNISSGGCQLNVQKNTDYSAIEDALTHQGDIELEVFFPLAESPSVILGKVKSAECQVDGSCKVGISFNYAYESVRLYLESLQLDSVSPFFN